MLRNLSFRCSSLYPFFFNSYSSWLIKSIWFFGKSNSLIWSILLIQRLDRSSLLSKLKLSFCSNTFLFSIKFILVSTTSSSFSVIQEAIIPVKINVPIIKNTAFFIFIRFKINASIFFRSIETCKTPPKKISIPLAAPATDNRFVFSSLFTLWLSLRAPQQKTFWSMVRLRVVLPVTINIWLSLNPSLLFLFPVEWFAAIHYIQSQCWWIFIFRGKW